MILSHDTYMPMYQNKDKFIILVTGGRGCEDPETEIIMSDLTTKKIRDVEVGDSVMGDDGAPRKVLNTFRGRGMMYKIHQANAEDYIVNDTHILSLKKRASAMLPSGGVTKSGTPKQPNGRYPQYGEYCDIPIKEFMEKSNKFRSCFSGYKCASIPFEEKSVRIAPYFLGLWLGDGTECCQDVTTPEKEIRAYLKKYAESLGLKYWEKECRGCVLAHLSRKELSGNNVLLDLMRSYNLIGNKHIPQDFISNSEEVRLELLAGLIDTDGCYEKKGNYEIIQKRRHLAYQIKYVADTLGFRTSLSEKRSFIGTKDCGIYYRVSISGDIDRIPCIVERKRPKKSHYQRKSWLVSSLSIEPMGEGDWCGIYLDGNHRYLHKDGTVTHNSGKSFATSTFIERLTFELGKDTTGNNISHQILYCRYTMTSAGMSIIPEVMDKINQDGTAKYFAKTKSDIVNVMTGSHIMFRGIKTSSGNQTAKLKSIKGLSVFVCDEAEEFVNEKDFETIVYSIRQHGLKNLVIIIMNPSDSNHFIYKRYIKDTHRIVEYDGVPVQISTHPNVLHIHTSYLDNLEHLAPNFIEEAKNMKERDPERYGHIFMGRWADVAEGAVFKKWGIVKEFPEYCKTVCLGADFGYTNDVTAIVKVGFVDNRMYIDELCYMSAMLTSDIIKVFRAHGDYHVICESADPRLVDEIALGGVIIYPVIKGPGSVIAGIEKMKEMEIFVTERSSNVQEELRNYTWAKDKDGNYINEPIDKYNHAIDAARYVVLGKILGKIAKPINTTKERLGLF